MTESFQYTNADTELVCYTDNKGVIQLRLGGNLSSDYEDEFIAWAAAVRTAVRTAKERNSNQVLCFIDLSGRAIDVDYRVHSLWIDLLADNKDYVTRTAVYGGGVITHNLVDIAIKAAKRTNMQVFNTKAEAEEWVFGGEDN